ncbi:MAG TPA: NAD(P)/FAD-dependent oxidoreductase [Bryobacteraceae bacterium]|nr:NAD(P)/FAD-dependent oxidoreductase [Bryobacteraceae bacterium]
MHRVAIVGGGFGGLYAAKALRKAPADVLLIDRRNFHLFQPLLYQVATGALSPGEIAAPLRAVLGRQGNTRVLLGAVVDLNADERWLALDDGTRHFYDSLIIAAGAQNFYYGHDEWARVAPGLKSIEDATRIRHKIYYAFEAAERETDPEARRAWLTFVIVGAGPTGVELAGALGEIANDVLRSEFRSIRPSEAQVILLEGTDRVLETFDAQLSPAAERSLVRLGVRTRTGVRVNGITEQGVNIQSTAGEGFIAARTVLWAAGVRTSDLSLRLKEHAGAELDRGGRVMVDEHCNIPGRPEIFVVGDMAHFVTADDVTLPGVAPVAIQMGNYAARTIARRLKGLPDEPFHYFDKGTLAVIGRGAGVAQFPHFHFTGIVAWLLWLFVHLMYLVGFQNRLIVFIRWGFAYFTYNRGARLITGDPGVPRTVGQPGPQTRTGSLQ